MWESYGIITPNVAVNWHPEVVNNASVAVGAQTFRVNREGRLMPIPEPEPLPTVAYPRHIVTDGQPTSEATLSSRFFEKNAAHLIGRRTGNGVWPDDPENAEAKRLFEAGQNALYDSKDANAAINFYEAAIEQDAGYIKAWVALAIAYITDNTADSLDRADDALSYLADIEPNEWLTAEASGIIHQNRGYLNVHRFRQGGERDRTLLNRADTDYAVCDVRTDSGRVRLEYLCPWAYVKVVRGEGDAARALWERAAAHAKAIGAGHLLTEYAAKYTPLREFING